MARLIWEFGDWFGSGAPPEDEIRASVERIMEGGDGAYLLGSAGGDEPQGVCQLRFRWSVWKSADDAWLEDLYVRDAARRSGLGRALVEAALDVACERGCRRVELDVQEDNVPALGLYEGCGFKLEPKGDARTLFISRTLD